MIAWWRVLDERDPRGGRAKAVLFLTHPGPSLLVTGVAVAATSILRGRLASAGTIAALVLVVLPAQLATGALNDWADSPRDGTEKPFKPIPRGAVARGTAGLMAAGGFGLSLAAAARWGWQYLLIDLLGAGSGAAYDLWLKRTPASVLCWWGGFEAVVLLATTAAGVGGALTTVPLSGLIATALHVSNALPDSAGDRRSGVVTLPTLVGPAWSRAIMVAGFGLGTAYTLAAAAAFHLGSGARTSAALLGVAALVAGSLPGSVLRRLGFALLALLTAVAAVSWVAALPGTTLP